MNKKKFTPKFGVDTKRNVFVFMNELGEIIDIGKMKIIPEKKRGKSGK